MPLSLDQVATLAMGGVTMTIGCCTSLFVLVSFLRYHYGRIIKAHVGPLFLVFMSALMSLCSLVNVIFMFINQELTESWCQFAGITITLNTGGVVFGHILLAFERYYLVMKQRALSWTFMIVFLSSLYAYSLVVCLLQLFYTNRRYVLMEGGLWCFLNWTEPSHGDRLTCILVLCFCLFSSSLINHAYLSVILKTRNVYRDINMRRATPRVGLSHMESKVLNRCLLIAGCFALFYTPSTLSFFYRFFSGHHIARELDQFMVLWPSLDLTMTPCLVVFMSADFKKAVLAYLPRSLKPKFEQWMMHEQSPEVADTSKQHSSIVSDIQKSIVTQDSQSTHHSGTYK